MGATRPEVGGTALRASRFEAIRSRPNDALTDAADSLPSRQGAKRTIGPRMDTDFFSPREDYFQRPVRVSYMGCIIWGYREWRD